MACKCFANLKGMDKDTRRKMIIYIGLMASIAENASYRRINQFGMSFNRQMLHDCGLVTEIVERFSPPGAHVLPDYEGPPEHIVDICIDLLDESCARKAKKDSDIENNAPVRKPPPGNTTEAQVAKIVHRRLPMPPPTVWWEKLDL